MLKITDLELESDGRAPLSGTYEQIREGAAWLGTQGVTEVFYDLNWDPLITLEPAAAGSCPGDPAQPGTRGIRLMTCRDR